MNREYTETNKQKICECGGKAFTIMKSIPPALEWTYESVDGEVQTKRKRFQGEPNWCCISCGEIHNHSTLKYIEVERFSYLPDDLQFMPYALRTEIDKLILLVERGIDPTEQIALLKQMLPDPYVDYSPLWEI